MRPLRRWAERAARCRFRIVLRPPESCSPGAGAPSGSAARFTGRGGAPCCASARSRAVPASSARAASRAARIASACAAAHRIRLARQMLDDMQQVRLAALVGAAVALDQAAGEGDLVAEPPVGRAPRSTAASQRSISACSWRSGCRAGAAACRRRGRAAPACRRRCGCASLSGRAKGACAARDAAPVPAPQRGGEARRQQRRELRHAGLEVVVRRAAARRRARRPRGARARAAGAALQLGDAHDVVEGHPQREPARGLARRRMAVRAVAVAHALGRQHALQALHVERGVGASWYSRSRAWPRASMSCTSAGKARASSGARAGPCAAALLACARAMIVAAPRRAPATAS